MARLLLQCFLQRCVPSVCDAPIGGHYLETDPSDMNNNGNGSRCSPIYSKQQLCGVFVAFPILQMRKQVGGLDVSLSDFIGWALKPQCCTISPEMFMTMNVCRGLVQGDTQVSDFSISAWLKICQSKHSLIRLHTQSLYLSSSERPASMGTTLHTIWLQLKVSIP